ncbi:type 1 fimbrial minor subunit FimI [Enterobacter asburiae]|uniref:fimbrial protein n=1 Tax=Enterobacter asburiae TaxID=61645 RepID=UPI00192BEAAA|nr:fimbrial protein [Enterobacter asburiae]MBL5926030.1 type 1 fimbrial protein [Enterobacter asburiae]MBL5956815.1 type 1 fimbrial protein [Enterobacter asburiae]
MRGIILALFCILSSYHIAHAGNNWNVMLPGGDMRFKGLIIAESCSVEAGDQNMTVEMGQVNSNRFSASGQDINPVPFDIHLLDCNTNVSQNVGVTFHGVSDGKQPHVLSVGEGPGIATGVGIALFDNENRLMPLNTPPLHWTTLYNGSNTLHFIAKYRATGNSVTGGIANAQAWFSLTYQ